MDMHLAKTLPAYRRYNNVKYVVFCSRRYREINSESEYSLDFLVAAAATFYCVLEEKKCDNEVQREEKSV
jgi:hypothetical protein